MTEDITPISAALLDPLEQDCGTDEQALRLLQRFATSCGVTCRPMRGSTCGSWRSSSIVNADTGTALGHPTADHHQRAW
jgi:hypothetical protein